MAEIRVAMTDLPKRTTHRWTGYDYAQQGAYYLTICTQDRLHRFGHIAEGVLHPSPIGELARQCWDAIPQHMPHVDVGEFVVMPNHVHGIVVIRERLVDARGRAMDGGVGVDGVGARHDAPDTNALDAPDTNALDAPDMNALDAPDTNALDAPDTNALDAPDTNALDAPDMNALGASDTTTNAPDDPGTGMPAVIPDPSDANGQHTRARHDAPLRDPRKPPGIPRGALGQIVATYKSAVTRMAYRDGSLPHGIPLWQRNYWDRVIRDDGEYERVARYIRDNPANWKGDRFNR
jgi:REP element-mobilizing transposase RayT